MFLQSLILSVTEMEEVRIILEILGPLIGCCIFVVTLMIKERQAKVKEELIHETSVIRNELGVHTARDDAQFTILTNSLSGFTN